MRRVGSQLELVCYEDYIDPFVTIMVADTRSIILDTHDTPPAKERRATHVFFNHQVHGLARSPNIKC
eukprot:4434566-Amphidinium_carterae.1